MKFSTTRKTIYNTTLERAFKCPILCDVSKIHTGLGIMPSVTHCTEDEDWGKEGSIKKVHVAKSLTQKGGFGSTDKIVTRIENKYWKIEVSNFQSWMLGFYKFVGEWETTPLSDDQIQIKYTYTLYSKNPLFFPFNWIFTKTFWRRYMKQVLRNIQKLAEGDEPFQHD